MSAPTVVLVPGACHGAWWYAPVVDALTARGHRALAVTLPGIGERAGELAATTNLASHIEDLTAHLARLDGDLVLVGHSYGGMVIAGVADALADRVVGLCAVDGFAPENGDSCWSSVNDAMRAWYVDGAARTGALAADRAWTPWSPFPAVADRLRRDPSWTVHDLPTTHNVLADRPDLLVEEVLADATG